MKKYLKLIPAVVTTWVGLPLATSAINTPSVWSASIITTTGVAIIISVYLAVTLFYDLDTPTGRGTKHPPGHVPTNPPKVRLSPLDSQPPPAEDDEPAYNYIHRKDIPKTTLKDAANYLRKQNCQPTHQD